MSRYEIAYKPQGPTLAAFHESDKRIRFLRGPLGSGKTLACIMELFNRICDHPPHEDGVRRSRWLVTRNTYPDLETTTIRDWLDVCSRELGPFSWGHPPEHRMDFKLEDGTRVQAEVFFIALDREDHVKKLRGMQLTGAWLNEAKEQPKAILDMIDGRIGRYPKRSEVPDFWYGIIGDTNAPDTDHWFYDLAERDVHRGKLPDWGFFHQPGGVWWDGSSWRLNEEAENRHNLPPDYYQRQMQGKSDDWIKVNLANEYGFVQDGRPIYPEYADQVHCGGRMIEPQPGFPLIVGIDFGLTPAAVLLQVDQVGRWSAVDELVTENMGAMRFGRELKRKIDREYRGFDVEFHGDPAGEGRSQVDERTPFEALAEVGIEADPAPSNDFTKRREAVADPLSRIIDGQPGLVVSAKCEVLRKGLMGAYKYRRLQVAGDARYQDKPDKNQWSHVCEAMQYGMLGGGENPIEGDDPLMGSHGPPNVTVSRSL